MKQDRKFSRPSSPGQTAAAPRIEIYFKTWCPYSQRARALLNGLGVKYTAIDVTHDRVLEAEMIDRSGRPSVPQIFIDNHHVGGQDDLEAFIASGAFARRFGGGAETPLAA
jgi:GrxC family glutaredoxin